MFSTPPSSLPHVKSGRLRGLAVTSAERLATLPDLVTARESGFPDLEISGWYGVAAPANTPRDIIVKLNGEIARAMKLNDVREKLATEGIQAKTNSPEEMTAFVRSEYERWGKVTKASNVKAD